MNKTQTENGGNIKVMFPEFDLWKVESGVSVLNISGLVP